jgi:spore coat polysaccharide biosynthesis protein SpsF (cytidylyltransferase family)
MRTVAIIQARVGSTRLPGKVLADVAGVSVLSYVVNRTRMAKRVDDVIVACPASVEDGAIVSACAKNGTVPVLCGPEHDVLSRYDGAATIMYADRVVRITADCPLIDPDVIDATIDACDGKPWASNVHPDRTWPDGLDVEVFTVKTLRRLDELTTDPRDREHVTPLLYRGAAGEGGSLRCPVALGDLRWTVDTQQDLDWVRQVYSRLPWNASWQQVLFSGIEHRRSA